MRLLLAVVVTTLVAVVAVVVTVRLVGPGAGEPLAQGGRLDELCTGDVGYFPDGADRTSGPGVRVYGPPDVSEPGGVRPDQVGLVGCVRSSRVTGRQVGKCTFERLSTGGTFSLSLVAKEFDIVFIEPRTGNEIGTIVQVGTGKDCPLYASLGSDPLPDTSTSLTSTDILDAISRAQKLP